MSDYNNDFLATLMAAMENNQATDTVLKSGPKDGEINLPTEDEGPGDDGNPIAKNDPDFGELDEGDFGSLTISEEESPPAPGDKNGDAANEAFGMRSKGAKESVANLSGKALTDAFLKALSDAGTQVVSTREFCQGIIDEDKEDGIESANSAKIVSVNGGFAIVNDEAGEEVVTLQLKSGKLARIFNTKRMRAYLAKGYDANVKAENKANKAAAKAAKKNPQEPAAEADGNFDGFMANVTTHGSKTESQTPQAKVGNDPSGNPAGPGAKGTAVTTGSNEKPATLDKHVNDSYDASGNTGSPGVNGTPVSKSGDSTNLPKNEAEKAADDKSGNPDGPGVNGAPSPSLESFIAACEQLMTARPSGDINIPNSMSLESYAMQLGLGVIASKAMEADLTAAERRALPDSDFGLPSKRTWPLNDEAHVLRAIEKFFWCAKEDQRELAKNILAAIRKFGMKDITVTEGNPFLKYYPEATVVPRKKKTSD